MKDANGLTPKQAAFVREYLIDKNGAQAAIRAGYSKKNASRIAIELLNKNHVSEQVNAGLIKQQERTEVTADRVLRELAAIAFADTRKLYREDGSIKSPGELDDRTASALAGIDTEERDGEDGYRAYTRKVKQWDKVKALELLGKHLGLYPTRGTLSIALDGQVDVQHTHRIEGRRVARRLILEEIREEDGLSLETGTGTGRVALPLNTDDFGEEDG